MLRQHEALAAAVPGGYRSEDFVRWLEGWLQLANSVLTWDFSQSTENESVIKGMRTPGKASVDMLGDSESIFLLPGPDWREVLTDGSLLDQLFAVAARARGALGLARLSRQALVAMVNLDGDVFAGMMCACSCVAILVNLPIFFSVVLL